MGRFVALAHPDLDAADVECLVARIRRAGCVGWHTPTHRGAVIEVSGPKAAELAMDMRSWPGIETVCVGQDRLLACRDANPERSHVDVGGVRVGGDDVVVIAGPCSMDGPEMLLDTAQAVSAAGATMFRVGLFKPRTSPYSFQGMGQAGFDAVRECKRRYGLPVVTEVLSVRDIEDLLDVADVLQVGARNMQNFALLRELGSAGRPVLLKRGLAATVNEWLSAAEYLLAHGNPDVVLCERGIRTFEQSTRFTLDLNAVPVAKELTHLPVIVDPSHGTGHARFVTPMSAAAIAAGADGLIIEVHPRPAEALSDGQQSLDFDAFASLTRHLRGVAGAVGRRLPERRRSQVATLVS